METAKVFVERARRLRDEHMEVLRSMYTHEEAAERYTHILVCSERHAASQVADLHSDRELESLTYLAERPWWRRCWGIQEAILSQQVLCIYGEISISLDAILSTYRVLRLLQEHCMLNPDGWDILPVIGNKTSQHAVTQASPSRLLFSPIFSSLRFLDFKLCRTANENGVTISEVLDFTRSTHASDP